MLKRYLEKKKRALGDKKKLFENIGYLLIIQIANYVLPTLTIPYLVKVLTVDKFGLIMFAQAFIQYLIILTDFGFSLTATKDIAIFRHDKNKISYIFSNIFFSKLFLLLISFIILNIFILFFNKFSDSWIVFYFYFGTVIGNVLFPSWYFQGIEEMKYITFFNVISRIFYAVLIFLFIKEDTDYMYVPLINSLSSVLIGIFSLWLVFSKFNICLKPFSVRTIFNTIKNNIFIFFSTASYQIYSNSPKFLIGIFFSMKEVAFFSLAERIIFILRQLLNAFFQSFYPNLAGLLKQGFDIYAERWKYLFNVALLISSLLYILVILIPENIFSLVFLKEYITALYILKVYSISLILQALMNMFGMQSMLLLGFSREYGISYGVIALSFVLILSIIISICKSMILVLLSILITEIIIIIYRVMFLYRKGILHELFKFK